MGSLEWMERKKKCNSDKWAAGKKGKGRGRGGKKDIEKRGKKGIFRKS